MKLLYGRDAELVAMAEPISASRFRDDAKTIGVEIEGDIRAIFVFDTFSTTGCYVHISARRMRDWLPADPRDVLTPVFAFPFLQCGYARITTTISARNRPSLAFTKWIGGTREGLLRRACPDGSDLVVFGMLRQECRWLPPVPENRL